MLNAVGRLTDRFAYPLRLSHYVELVNPLCATHAMWGRVEAVWDETRDARTLTLKPGLNWRGYVRLREKRNSIKLTREGVRIFV